jgi:hypothetical protein
MLVVRNVLLPLVILTILYGTTILGLIWLLRRVGIKSRWAIVLGFVIFGAGTGLMSAWLWPFDSSLYPNVWAVLLGDRLYQLSASYLLDLWPLRVPRVYVCAGALLYGGFGLLAQWLYGRRKGQQAQTEVPDGE